MVGIYRLFGRYLKGVKHQIGKIGKIRIFYHFVHFQHFTHFNLPICIDLF